MPGVCAWSNNVAGEHYLADAALERRIHAISQSE